MELDPPTIKRLNRVRAELAEMRTQAAGVTELAAVERMDSFVNHAMTIVDRAFYNAGL